MSSPFAPKKKAVRNVCAMHPLYKKRVRKERVRMPKMTRQQQTGCANRLIGLENGADNDSEFLTQSNFDAKLPPRKRKDYSFLNDIEDPVEMYTEQFFLTLGLSDTVERSYTKPLYAPFVPDEPKRKQSEQQQTTNKMRFGYAAGAPKSVLRNGVKRCTLDPSNYQSSIFGPGSSAFASTASSTSLSLASSRGSIGQYAQGPVFRKQHRSPKHLTPLRKPRGGPAKELARLRGGEAGFDI
jgi:hypothetical protein